MYTRNIFQRSTHIRSSFRFPPHPITRLLSTPSPSTLSSSSTTTSPSTLSSSNTTTTSTTPPYYRKLTNKEILAYHTNGYLTINNIILPHELSLAQKIFNKFMNKELAVEGNDYGIHTPGLVNVTAYTLYHPLETLEFFYELQLRCYSIAKQLYSQPPLLALDYVQLLRKLPNHPTAIFPPHQDFTYWPKSLSKQFDMRTATISVAINKANQENGCLWVLPESHVSQLEYKGSGRDTLQSSRTQGGGVIQQHLDPKDINKRVFLPLEAGDITIHDAFILHGSEGNQHLQNTRDTAIFAYRAPSMIAFERQIGFRHSYNDKDEVLKQIRETYFP